MKKEKSLNEKTPISSMKEEIEKITTPIFQQVLNETNKNHVSVGGVGQEKDYSYSFYNPHNARYYFKFDRSKLYKKSKGGVGLKPINKSELCNPDFLKCRVVIKKNQIEITNKINKERMFKIDGNIDNRSLQVLEANVTMEKESINVLKEFIKIYGGESDCKAIKVWIPDNKHLHDKLIDSMPIEQTFRNEVVKNVYNDHPANVEYSNPAFSSNAFRNMGLHDYAPAIAEELESMRDLIHKCMGLQYLKNNIKKIDDVFKLENFIILLEEEDKLELGNWIFEKFGNHPET